MTGSFHICSISCQPGAVYEVMRAAASALVRCCRRWQSTALHFDSLMIHLAALCPDNSIKTHSSQSDESTEPSRYPVAVRTEAVGSKRNTNLKVGAGATSPSSVDQEELSLQLQLEVNVMSVVFMMSVAAVRLYVFSGRDKKCCHNKKRVFCSTLI